MSQPPSLILGIDPGSLQMGFSLLSISHEKKSFELVISGTWEAPASHSFYNRLSSLANKYELFLEKYHPQMLVLEKSFYGNNVNTAIKMGEIRGAILAISGKYALSLKEYSPTSVKKSITGYGQASKTELQETLSLLLPSKKTFKTSDESDAIALAIAYYYREQNSFFRSCFPI